MKRKERVSTDGKPWARYERLSTTEAAEDRDKTKAERMALTHIKLDAQRAETTAWLDENGLPYRDDLVFRDAALSASKPNVIRPDWDRMMELAQSGQLGGIAIVAIDRFTRDVTTMEDLIKLADTYKVGIGGPRAGNLDLTTYQGIQQARGMAVQAANESLATSFRIKGTLARKMRAGQPMGARCYGFEIGGVVQRPAEVAIIREMIDRVLANESLENLARDLNGRVDAEGNPLTTVRGAKWRGKNLGRMLLCRRYIGIVEHHGEDVGVIPGEPVLDRKRYDRLQAKMTSRRKGRRPNVEGGEGFWLTGLLFCGNCGHRMSGTTRHKPLKDGVTKVRDYRCPVTLDGCGRSIVAKPVEDMVDDHMVDVLADRDRIRQMVAENTLLNEARAELYREKVEIDEDMANLEVKKARRETSRLRYDRAMPIYEQRLAEVTAELARLEPAQAEEDYDPDADWADMVPEERRRTIERLHVRIEIGPKQGPARRFDSRRVTFPQ